MIHTAKDIQTWADAELDLRRKQLEKTDSSEVQTAILRGRIAQLKDLLVALENKAPPVWSNGSDDPL